jgi:integrase
MSIQKRQRKKGTVYVVHYYDPDAPSGYSNKTFDRRRDAVAFEATVNLAKRTDTLADLDAGTESLNSFLKTWWERHGDRFLEAHTRKEYKRLIKAHIEPELGKTSLRRITPTKVAALRDQIIDGNGSETARKVLAILQGILERAIEWEALKTANPVKAVKKPGGSRKSRPRTLDPSEVEGLRARMAQRDATLVSVLAYAGLRPGEALALTWEDVGEHTLDITKAIALGEEKDTKTGRTRVVRPYDAALRDLRAWRLASGTRTGWVFPREKDGQPWRDTDYRNWRTRKFKTKTDADPYDLRHSFASLLFHEGRSPATIAEQMGHTVQTLLDKYIHIIEELRDQDRVDGEALITEARSETRLKEVAT